MKGGQRFLPTRWVMVSALAAALAACGGAPKPKPTPLEPVKAEIAGRAVWNYRLDGVQFPLTMASDGSSFTVAGNDGRIVVLAASDGRELWRADAGARVGAGVGGDGRRAAVVTADNRLVVVEAGRVAWTKALTSRVSTAPLVAGERVFVMGVDRIVHAFDALDGRRLWTLQRPGDALMLAQASVVAAFKDTLLVAQGPRLVGVDPTRGTVRWEVPVATPRGTNEVERLADLVGPVARVGDTVCVRAFQAAVGCVDAERGSLLWTKNAGGRNGVAATDQLVYGADGSDRVTAWRTAGGDVAWTSERLLHRGLSGPLALGPTVVFGDFEGQVHFLSREDGRTVLRLPTDGSPIVGSPALAGTTMLVATRNGGLYAFRPE